jgi:hypothetical protein
VYAWVHVENQGVELEGYEHLLYGMGLVANIFCHQGEVHGDVEHSYAVGGLANDRVDLLTCRVVGCG